MNHISNADSYFKLMQYGNKSNVDKMRKHYESELDEYLQPRLNATVSIDVTGIKKTSKPGNKYV